MLRKRSNTKTLSPDLICRQMRLAGGEKDFNLPIDVEGYGITSGAAYKPGRNKTDGRDLDNPVLLYWADFMLCIETPFLGKVATAENMYGAQVNVTCRVSQPKSLYRLFLGDSNELTLTAFTEIMGPHVRKELSRLACRFSPEAVIQGAAREAATAELTENLRRIYSAQGVGLCEISLVDITRLIREKEEEYIRKKIECEAQERDIGLEQAWADQQRRLDEAAGRGDAGAERAATILAGRSADDLRRRLPSVRASAAADKDKREGRMETEPVIVGGKHDAGGRFAVLRPDKPPRCYEMLRSWFCVGRNKNCDVPISAAGVSSLHFTAARIGSGLTLVDHGSACGTIYNGERIMQRFIESGDAFRIGDAWVVFKLEPGQEFIQLDRRARGSMRMDGGTLPPARFHENAGDFERKPDDEVSAMVLLSSSAGCHASSESRPLFIGSDSICDIQLGGGGVARFHAVVCWDAEPGDEGRAGNAGVFVEDLHSGRGTLCNGRPVRRARLSDGDILEAGGHRIAVSFTGNVERRAGVLAAVTPEQGKLALTCIEGPDEGLTFPLDPKHADRVLGRDENADIIFTGDEISGKHARITAEMTEAGGGSYRPVFSIEDLGSTNGTAVNRHELKKGEKYKLGPGDIVRLGCGEGHCDLLVHYAR